MKNVILTISAFLFLFSLQLKADEGMWIISLINKNYDEMKAKGLLLSAEDIYDINNACIKDAVIRFGRGCTGEIISNEGLLITNHHCGYSWMQSLSSVDHDYITDGYWAMNKGEEIPTPGLSVTFLVRFEDVTEKVLAELTDEMTEDERSAAVRKISKIIEKESAGDSWYDARVSEFFEGNQYFLCIYETYNDIRFVGAPPATIGDFGGDTDNWMWPRHTGDFSMFRIYMSPDGKPADYSTDNIPFKPKHFLPVSLKGVKENDFTMIIGFPGRTNRYLTSYGIDEAINLTNPATVRIRDKKLEILRRNMDLSKETEIKYAAKYAGTSNYWKYFIGQTAGLKRLNVFDKKKELEEQFSKWIENDPDRRKFYGNVLKDFSITYDTLKDFALLRTYLNEAAFRGPDIIGYASGFARLSRMLESENRDTAAIRQEVARLLEASKDFFKDFDIYTEKELFESLMSMFYNDIDPALQPTIFEKVRTKYKGNFSKFTYYAYNESIFKGKNEVFAYLTDPRKTPLDNDPLFMTALSLSGRFRQLSTEYKAALDKLDHAKRLYLKGLMEMLPEKWFYPDANSTMRLTYGHACSYFPRDAVKYKLYTTLDGIIQKEDTCDREFLVPEKLKTLHRTKDYGPYGDNGIMYVCFITNNDITGGNSGSPVLNGKGELIGLAFDGNWEAMSGDIAFEPALQRTIVVDIRYVLFVIDKFAGASHLVKEMKLEE